MGIQQSWGEPEESKIRGKKLGRSNFVVSFVIDGTMLVSRRQSIFIFYVYIEASERF